MLTAEPQRAGVGEQIQLRVVIPGESGISFNDTNVFFSVNEGGIFTRAAIAVPDSGMVSTELTAHSPGRYEVTALFSAFEQPGESDSIFV